MFTYKRLKGVAAHKKQNWTVEVKPKHVLCTTSHNPSSFAHLQHWALQTDPAAAFHLWFLGPPVYDEGWRARPQVWLKEAFSPALRHLACASWTPWKEHLVETWSKHGSLVVHLCKVRESAPNTQQPVVAPCASCLCWRPNSSLPCGCLQSWGPSAGQQWRHGRPTRKVCLLNLKILSAWLAQGASVRWCMSRTVCAWVTMCVNERFNVEVVQLLSRAS